MLANFARMVRGPMRTVPDHPPEAGAPPERFVEKVPDEYGDVYVSPILERLRHVLRRGRQQAAEPSPDAPQAGPPGARLEGP